MARECLQLALACSTLLASCALPPARDGTPAPAPAAPSIGAQAPVAPKPPPGRYLCDNGIEFDVRFSDGSAQLLFTSREPETVLRDAGGTSPQHTVYSSTKVKAEFGLDPDARGAQLNFASPPLEARCVRGG